MYYFNNENMSAYYFSRCKHFQQTQIYSINNIFKTNDFFINKVGVLQKAQLAANIHICWKEDIKK